MRVDRFLNIFLDHKQLTPQRSSPQDCSMRWGQSKKIKVSKCFLQVNECVENKIRRARLRRFGHVERKKENDRVKNYTKMNVTGVVDRGAPRKTWRSCVKRDMKAMGIKEEMAQDHCAWRNITGDPTRASADA